MYFCNQCAPLLTYVFGGLHVGDAVEDDVEASRQDPGLVRLPRHGVRLARVGDAIGKQKAWGKE